MDVNEFNERKQQREHLRKYLSTLNAPSTSTLKITQSSQIPKPVLRQQPILLPGLQQPSTSAIKRKASTEIMPLPQIKKGPLPSRASKKNNIVVIQENIVCKEAKTPRKKVGKSSVS